MEQRWACVDGNEAAARVAHKLSEVIAIYPITPASSMGELADEWSAAGQPNLWGDVPTVIEMQSEGGAAGAVHGALLKGSLATTFTSSQGLLLMLPNMFKIAGELTPAVIHVAARTIATHALSIFGDHSDVMAARSTGWAMLASSSVQEAHDMALISHLATLESRVPFLHFFDGFRTSHEVNKISLLSDDDIRALVKEAAIAAHRARGLSPDDPQLRGSAQNPDVFFQAREACSPFYAAVPGIIEDALARMAVVTGRRYGLVEYIGAPDAERVVVAMGSGTATIEETVNALNETGDKVGLLKVRLYRPFPAEAFVAALPATVRSVAVLDRTKEPGAVGEPLYQDVIAALVESGKRMPRIIGGRYGLASKEFTPAMVAAVFSELGRPQPKDHFTVGIVDDVSHSHLPVEDFPARRHQTSAVFFGLGSDGTVGANKQSVKIVGEGTDLSSQGYFVYDSKKSGSVTVSHVRFDEKPIDAPYLIEEADFIGCHQFHLLQQMDVTGVAGKGAKLLINSPYGSGETWALLPTKVQLEIVEKELDVYLLNAHKLARDIGLGSRINTIMQAGFFALTDVLPTEEALAAMRDSIRKTYGKRGEAIVDKNLEAIDRAVGAIEPLRIGTPNGVASDRMKRVLNDAPDFVKLVTERMLAGAGDTLPVSALPIDGAFPTGTARFEKRSIAQEIPIWDPDICIDCAHCVVVCPHAAIRMKVYDPGFLESAPGSFKSKEFHAKELPGQSMTIQVAPDDCTGCGICVDVCPVKSKTAVKHKAVNMEPIGEHLEVERASFDFFLGVPSADTSALDPASVKGTQARTPLFEFSGACAGCGETPYLKLLSQMFGDRLVIANATGCSSIYGGNLPTTPWATDEHGRGPAWANSLFEDNAEFGLGIRLAADSQRATARRLLAEVRDEIGEVLADELLGTEPEGDAAIAAYRGRVQALKAQLAALPSPSPTARRLLTVADELVPRSVWIVGGDGWAYDIGSSGLDHVLASGHDVNVLVLDTEVYSNTGGQASKATPRGAVAKFAARGKPTGKKDLGMIAASYGGVYVAQISLGANYNQTIKAFAEAEAWPGPSLIIAYSTCIAHGIDMSTSMTHQKDAVKSGYWPLYRYSPGSDEHEQPFVLDSKEPTIPFRDFAASEGRFAMLQRTAPEEAARLSDLEQKDIDERWRLYRQMATVERSFADVAEQPEGEGVEQ